MRAGPEECWTNYTWMSFHKFLHLTRTTRLNRYVKKLVFYSAKKLSLEWTMNLLDGFHGCFLGFFEITDLETFHWKTNSTANKILSIYWEEFNYLYLPRCLTTFKDDWRIHIIKSLKIDSPDVEFLEETLPLMSLLRILHIENPRMFYVKKKICLTNLYLGYFYKSSVYHLLLNFDLLKLEFLRIPKVDPCRWLKLN